MLETLKGLESGAITPQPQDHSRATLAPILKKEDGRADFASSAQRIYNRLRGFQPWPGCFTNFREKKLAIVSARPVSAIDQSPSTMLLAGDKLLVACGEASALELLEVQPEGKRKMLASEFIRGYRPDSGEKLGM